MKSNLCVGDTVWWRGNFGTSGSKKAKVVRIEVVERGEKEGGTLVETVPWAMKDSIVVDLDNGHWAYGDQIAQL